MNSSKLKLLLNNLQLSDIYTLMLFILFKIKEIPEYATLSELCFLLDGSNLTRLFTYYAGKTVTFPTEKELVTLIKALLLYQYINLDGNTLTEALIKISDNELTENQKNEILNLYLKIIPIMDEYNINRKLVSNNAN